jgi:hypothetical protein
MSCAANHVLKNGETEIKKKELLFNFKTNIRNCLINF